MKRFLTIIAALAIILTVAAAAIELPDDPLFVDESDTAISAGEGELDPGADASDTTGEAGTPADVEEVDLEYVRFVATGNDPYGTFHFKLDGENTTIDPDYVVWAAIRYRTVSQYDTSGTEFTAQFYVMPEREPCVPIRYNFTGQWETAIVDLTQVSEKTDFDSLWDAANYINVDIIRFDPLEPDRDSEDTSHDADSGKVKKGDCIDIAWIAFFESEYDARTYTGRENTPAAILDPDSLTQITNPNNMKASKQSEKAVLPTVAPATEAPTASPTPDATAVPTNAPATTAPSAGSQTADGSTDVKTTDGSGNASAAPASTDKPADNSNNSNSVLITALIVGGVLIASIVVVLLLIKNRQKKA